MSKKIAIGPRPTIARPSSQAVDQWVEDRASTAANGGEEKTARLTIDVPVSLHKQLKAHCAMEGLKMNQVLRSLIEQHLAEG